MTISVLITGVGAGTTGEQVYKAMRLGKRPYDITVANANARHLVVANGARAGVLPPASDPSYLDDLAALANQIEARFILTPDFMERLLGLERTFRGKQVRCAFAGGEMFLACEGKNLLEAGSMHRKMDDLGRVREMLLDFAAVFLLIDAMSQRLTPDALRGPNG